MHNAPTFAQCSQSGGAWNCADHRSSGFTRMHQGRQRAACTLLTGRKPAQKRERDDAAVAGRGFCGIPAFQGADAPCRVKSTKLSKEFPERVEDDEKPNSPRLVRPNECATEPARASLTFREARPVAMCSIRSARLRSTQASAAKGCDRRWYGTSPSGDVGVPC